MDHGALTLELYNLITAVPEFANITGTNLGGMQPDPTLIQLTPPACWVTFVGDESVEDRQESLPPQQEVMRFIFQAFIYLPMKKQQEMIQNWLPLLGKIIPGVRGQASTITGHRWVYSGQKLALVNTNRLVYAQRYTITGVM